MPPPPFRPRKPIGHVFNPLPGISGILSDVHVSTRSAVHVLISRNEQHRPSTQIEGKLQSVCDDRSVAKPSINVQHASIINSSYSAGPGALRARRHSRRGTVVHLGPPRDPRDCALPVQSIPGLRLRGLGTRHVYIDRGTPSPLSCTGLIL